MTTTAFTQAQLDALEAAIADGALKVSYNGKEVEYRSLKEMLKIRDIIRNALGLDPACKKNKGLFGGKRLKVEHSKGTY